MTTTHQQLRDALRHTDSSARLQSALAAGTRPQPEFAEVLVDACATEPDFFVRDMLTWALTRQPPELTVPLLLEQVRAGGSQARSQALHTLSKIGDPRAWPVISSPVLRDADDEVARAAWRAAVALVPHGSEPWLAAELATQLGRGDRQVRLSLSRALAGLGEAAGAVLAIAAEHADGEARLHALATQRLILHPDEGFDASVFEAQRMVALLGAPTPPEVSADADR